MVDSPSTTNLAYVNYVCIANVGLLSATQISYTYMADSTVADDYCAFHHR